MRSGKPSEPIWKHYGVSHFWFCSCLSVGSNPSPERIPSRQSLARPIGGRIKKKKHPVPWADIGRCSANELGQYVEPSRLPSGLRRLMDPSLGLWEEEVAPLALHIIRGEVGCLEGDRMPFCWIGQQEEDGPTQNLWQVVLIRLT